jgi:hypothetical protein
MREAQIDAGEIERLADRALGRELAVSQAALQRHEIGLCRVI